MPVPMTKQQDGEEIEVSANNDSSGGDGNVNPKCTARNTTTPSSSSDSSSPSSLNNDYKDYKRDHFLAFIPSLLNGGVESLRME